MAFLTDATNVVLINVGFVLAHMGCTALAQEKGKNWRDNMLLSCIVSMGTFTMMRGIRGSMQ